jgi:two-component system, NarL family, sensor histidine kinase UhpB
MQFAGNPEYAQLHGHRPLLMAVRIVVGVSLVLLAYLFTRIPVEDLSSAMDRYSVRRGEIAQVGRAIDAFPAATAVASIPSRLRSLGATPCAFDNAAAADNARLAQLGNLTDAYRRLPAAQGEQLLARMRESVRELETGAETCLNLEVADVVTKAVWIRRGTMVLVGMIALSVLGVIVLRHHDQQQLRQQLRFNEQLIDAIPLPLSLRSPEGRFMLVNQAFERKYKVWREHLIGQPVQDTLPKVHAEGFAVMGARAAASAEPLEQTFDIVEGKSSRHVQVKVHALRRVDESIIGVIGIETDVTALRHKEVQLTETNLKLGQLSVKMIDAQEDERRRIARDLHDQVGQILTALKLQLGSLAKRAKIDAPAEAMLMPIDLAEEALRHTRDLSASLHPHLLDDLGLESALGWLIDRFIRPSIPAVELRCRLQPARGPEAIELVAFRVVQEALTNVVRHAGATRVGVILEAHEGMLTIEVIDDGVGFDAGESWIDLQRSTSLGVGSMHDRVTEIGGELGVESKAGTGTSLRVRLPW